jgi:ubiquitin-protein ligase
MAWREPPTGNLSLMHESPRIRRLRSDLAAMERLRSESSVLRFRAAGKPTQHYVVEFRGKSLARVRGRVSIADRHELEIKLGASYPRTMPEIRWLTPIYHPNISEIGMVCLGGYGTHWVPSLNLDELCGMLWDMARYHNYDVRSPYNREAALWVANQSTFAFPVDARPLRDLRAALGRVEELLPLHPPAPQPPVHRSDPERADPGSKAGKYARFVRKFADELDKITPEGARRSISKLESTPEAVPVEERGDFENSLWPPDPPAATEPGPEPTEDDMSDLVFLVEDEPAPAQSDRNAVSPRLRASDEEILFIE